MTRRLAFPISVAILAAVLPIAAPAPASAQTQPDVPVASRSTGLFGAGIR